VIISMILVVNFCGENMSVTLFAMPKDYKTAFTMLRHRKKIEAYHDDLIPSSGVDEIRVIHPMSLSELEKTVDLYNNIKPDFIAFASLTITGFVRTSFNYNIAIRIAKKHFIKALKSAGIDSKNVKIEQIGE